jgi:alpha-amylase
MAKVNFAMGIHFHQPVGNFSEVFAKVYRNCYRPFLKLLHRYPDVKITLHFTGCLLEWLDQNEKEFFRLVNPLVARGQAEIMTGGFYEPILTMIPARDRKGQIAMLTEFVKKRFHYDALGAWVAERVWEPSLVSSLHEAGVRYVILDDTHFFYAGLKKDQTYGYYVTEDQNKPIAVFPSDKTLRYMIPFQPPEKIAEYFAGVARTQANPLFVYGDDAEKFGEWPGTFKWVYEEKWLTRFFDMLAKNKDWITTVKFSEHLAHSRPRARVYIPTASYEEMSEWSLPVEAGLALEEVLEEVRRQGKEDFYRPFIRGGFWRNFLSKYPESNQMQKRMLYVSRKLEACENKNARGRDMEEARKYLYRAQCNCAYWHGVFGGIYLFHLRKAIYENLLKAESRIDALNKKARKENHATVLKHFDIDGDGQKEVVLENNVFSVTVAPHCGGIVTELDYKPLSFNFLNVISRKKEMYHEDILARGAGNNASGEAPRTIHEAEFTVTPELKKSLVYDEYRKGMWLDHILEKSATLDEFQNAECDEKGDFLDGPYAYKSDFSHAAKEIVLTRKGRVMGKELHITKSLSCHHRNHEITCVYTLKSAKQEIKGVKFAVELNCIMPAANDTRVRYVCRDAKMTHSAMESHGVLRAIRQLKIRDAFTGVSLEFSCDKKTNVWRLPLYTVSQSERAFERNYQGSTVVFWWDMDFRPHEEKKRLIRIRVA